MWDVILDSLLDALKVFPFIFLVYFLIEFLEDKLDKHNKKSVLSGKAAPAFAALFGVIPQCGFSVMAAKLYDKRLITTGTVMSVFIATSDEALVILLTSGTKAASIIPLIVIKAVLAAAIGMLVNLLLKETTEAYEEEERNCMCGHEHNESRVKKYVLHPLGHAAKVFAYILAVNLVFGIIIYFIGEEAFVAFISGNTLFQPILTCLIGLIPNCASSVIITQTYVLGGISFGSCVAGLCVNAGLGYAVLFKNRKQLKRNLKLVGALFLLSIVSGYVINLITGVLI